MEGVDLLRLDAELSKIGWNRAQLEASIGKPVLAQMSREDKRMIWGHIIAAHAQLVRWRAWFPKATVTAIRLIDS
jgi:hypothetical protein